MSANKNQKILSDDSILSEFKAGRSIESLTNQLYSQLKAERDERSKLLREQRAFVKAEKLKDKKFKLAGGVLS